MLASMDGSYVDVSVSNPKEIEYSSHAVKFLLLRPLVKPWLAGVPCGRRPKAVPGRRGRRAADQGERR
jgi:hypothetical protein